MLLYSVGETIDKLISAVSAGENDDHFHPMVGIHVDHRAGFSYVGLEHGIFDTTVYATCWCDDLDNFVGDHDE